MTTESRPPINLPPARQPSKTTPRGHVKAVYLTEHELEEIIVSIEADMTPQDACHKVGTSYRQFTMAVRRRPVMLKRLDKIMAKRRRQRQALQSQHGRTAANDNTARLHQG